MKKFDLYFIPRCAVLVKRTRRPAINNPTVVHLSLLSLHFFFRHSFATYCLVALQSSSAERSTLRRICSPIFAERIDIREDANSHKVI